MADAQVPSEPSNAFKGVDSHAHIPFSKSFSDDVNNAVLDPEVYGIVQGIAIYGPSSKGKPRTQSVHLRDIEVASLPSIDPSELPLALDDPRRTYATPIPGVLTTHPGGWLEGSAPHSEMPSHTCSKDAEAAMEFIKKHDLKNSTDYQRKLKTEMSKQLKELEERMRERAQIMEQNDALDREIEELDSRREIQRQIESNIRANRGAKRLKLG